MKGLDVGADIGFIIDILGIRTDHQIAVIGRRDEDSFAQRRRRLKNHRADQMALLLVQQDILAAPGCDPIVVQAGQGGDPVAVDAGAVHDEAGIVRAFISDDAEIFYCFGDALDRFRQK